MACCSSRIEVSASLALDSFSVAMRPRSSVWLGTATCSSDCSEKVSARGLLEGGAGPSDEQERQEKGGGSGHRTSIGKGPRRTRLPDR